MVNHKIKPHFILLLGHFRNGTSSGGLVRAQIQDHQNGGGYPCRKCKAVSSNPIE
jgi:hypothetical protein